jgi:hypothetical protein
MPESQEAIRLKHRCFATLQAFALPSFIASQPFLEACTEI